MASFFIIAKTWRDPRCPPVGEWINKLWYIQTIEYYLTIKSYKATKRHEGTINIYCCVKQAAPERLHTL